MNCVKGDLAVIVCSDYPECLGRYVSVLTFYLDDGEAGWECQPHNPMPGSIWHEDGTIEEGPVNLDEQWIPDAWLRPIRPGDLTQEEVDALYKPEVIKQRDPEAA